MTHDIDRMHVVQTADGSATLHHPDYEQTYHSSHGALTETRHVFLGLGEIEARTRAGVPAILEVGIGTGLNLLATLSLAHELARPIAYTGIERRPPPLHFLQELDFPALEGMHDESWAVFLDAVEKASPRVELASGSVLEFHWDDFDRFPFDEARFDVIYHDGFSPEMNPELWSPQALGKLVATLKPGGALVTYTVQGAVRRALQALGLVVEKLPGPTEGKREVLRARKPA